MTTHTGKKKKDYQLRIKKSEGAGGGNRRLGLRIRCDPESLHFNSHYRSVFPGKKSPQGKPRASRSLSLASFERNSGGKTERASSGGRADGGRLAENEIERRAAKNGRERERATQRDRDAGKKGAEKKSRE